MCLSERYTTRRGRSRRADHLLAKAEVAARAQLIARLRSGHFRHYLPPALPAFRRICSPAYLMPLPLYGSGGRSCGAPPQPGRRFPCSRLRSRICVGCGARQLDSLRRLVLDRVREAKRELQPVGPRLRLVADADELELLLEALGHALDHVGDERARQAVQRLVVRFVRRTLDRESRRPRSRPSCSG